MSAAATPWSSPGEIPPDYGPSFGPAAPPYYSPPANTAPVPAPYYAPNYPASSPYYAPHYPTSSPYYASNYPAPPANYNYPTGGGPSGPPYYAGMYAYQNMNRAERSLFKYPCPSMSNRDGSTLVGVFALIMGYLRFLTFNLFVRRSPIVKKMGDITATFWLAELLISVILLSALSCSKSKVICVIWLLWRVVDLIYHLVISWDFALWIFLFYIYPIWVILAYLLEPKEQQVQPLVKQNPSALPVVPE